jgi:hypothetical protein
LNYAPVPLKDPNAKSGVKFPLFTASFEKGHRFFTRSSFRTATCSICCDGTLNLTYAWHRVSLWRMKIHPNYATMPDPPRPAQYPSLPLLPLYPLYFCSTYPMLCLSFLKFRTKPDPRPILFTLLLTLTRPTLAPASHS